MGLDITVQKINKIDKRYDEGIIDYCVLDEHEKELFEKSSLKDRVFQRTIEYFDIEGYLTRVAVPNSNMEDWEWYMTSWPDDDICYRFRYIPADQMYELRGANIGIYKKLEFVIYYGDSVGYQRRGMNSQFYKDYRADKIGYFVVTKSELEKYRDVYVEEDMREYFQKNIIDPFIEGEMVVTFSW